MKRWEPGQQESEEEEDFRKMGEEEEVGKSIEKTRIRGRRSMIEVRDSEDERGRESMGSIEVKDESSDEPNDHARDRAASGRLSNPSF